MRLRHLHPGPLIGLLLILATGWAEYRTATTDHPAHAAILAATGQRMRRASRGWATCRDGSGNRGRPRRRGTGAFFVLIGAPRGGIFASDSVVIV